MASALRQLLRKTGLSAWARRRKERRRFREFTAHDEACKRFYAEFIRPGDLVFDVGANMGNRTKPFLALGAKVIAFEPQQSCADFLAEQLAGRDDFVLVRKALGSAPGRAEMLISNAHTLSTLSRDWVDATQSSGRFAGYEWQRTQQVEITTLDAAIAEYGKPSFVKIDVEGFEYEVLSGLSQPVDALSIEYAAEFLPRTLQCIDHVEKLAPKVDFQFAQGEDMIFAFDHWVDRDTLVSLLRRLDSKDFGDVYMRCAR